jgi:hypothetical protein
MQKINREYSSMKRGREKTADDAQIWIWFGEKDAPLVGPYLYYPFTTI